MKKYLILTFLLLPSHAAKVNAQVQRLAILPSTMQAAEGKISSICIDLFERAPEGNDYALLGSSDKTFHSDNFSSVTNMGGNVDLGNTQFISTKVNDGPIAEYYKKFIDAKIAEYNGGSSSTPNELTNLQLEIWAYNGMDQLGWINRTNKDQIAEYDLTRKSFSFRYDLEADDYEGIVFKAKQIHEMQKRPLPAPMSDVQFSSSGLSTIISGEQHAIDVSYIGISFEDVADYSQQVSTDLRKFYRISHELPEEANFSIDRQHANAYLLSFYAESDDYGEIVMNFSIPQNQNIP